LRIKAKDDEKRDAGRKAKSREFHRQLGKKEAAAAFKAAGGRGGGGGKRPRREVDD